jgi:hypothetical protein
MVNNSYRKLVTWVVLIAFMLVNFQSAALAGLVDTPLLLQKQSVDYRPQIVEYLQREDVKQQLMDMGVDPQSAKQRVARLTTEEAELLHNRIQDMPAGAGPLEILVFVFLVLLITDILGFTDIFPFVKKPAR